MRLISQDGTADVSYEKVVLVVYENSIVAEMGHRTYLMAKYPTKENANAVMNLLHEVYTSFMEQKIVGTLSMLSSQPQAVFEFPKNYKVEDAKNERGKI